MKKRLIKPTPEQIRSWVSRYFPDNKDKCGGREIRINNPFSPGDNGYHLWINVEKAAVHDFRPSYSYVSGSFLWFVKKYKKISFRDAVQDVTGGDIRYYISDAIKTVGEIQHVTLPESFKKLDDCNDAISKTVRGYLHSRMISDEQITSHNIGYDGFEVVFPYYEYGEVVYWQSRSTINKKFNFPLDTNKTAFIYGFDNLEPGQPAIITESIFNSLMFDRGASIGGSSIDDLQIRRLKMVGVDSVIMALDNDESGRNGTADSYNKLSSHFNTYYSFTDGEDDWNKIAIDYGTQEARRMLARNIKILDLSASVKLRLQK